MVASTAALAVGGGPSGALAATLHSLSSSSNRTWCAVSSSEEAMEATGLAITNQVAPWTGPLDAMAQLYRATADRMTEDMIVLVAAGTLLRWPFLARARALIDGGAGLVFGSSDDRGRLAARRDIPLGFLGARALSHATVAPGSGVVVAREVLASLADAGWLSGEPLSLKSVREVAGDLRVVPGALGRFQPARQREDDAPSVTVMIAAYNEEAWIGDTLRSLKTQTHRPDEVLVIDDCSTDRTAEVARHLGARVIRTPQQSRKAGALNLGLREVKTDAVLTTDADTVLHPEAIGRLVDDLRAGRDATSGAVLPANARGIWAQGRLIEYSMALRLWKRAQASLGHLYVLSGCLSLCRVDVLHAAGGYSSRTVIEDIDLTWTIDQLGYKVGYVPKALAYPVEPTSWALYKAQMRRWSSAFFQSIAVHARTLPTHKGLGAMLGMAFLDCLLGIPVLVAILGMLVFGNRSWWEYWVIGQVACLAFDLLVAMSVVGPWRAIKAMPGFLVTCYTTQYFFFEAFVREMLMRRRLQVWIKGH